MKKKMAILALSLLFGCSHIQTSTQKPKNIIMVIVDGMGPEQVKAGRIFLGNQKLSFEQFPYQSTVTTHNVDGEVTDSAAAASAIATGQKVKNRVLSPGKTLLEHFKEQGKSTGIVTNTLLTDATPAAFAAHASSRKETSQILRNYLELTQPNFIAGADETFYLEQVKKAPIPYKVIQNLEELHQIPFDCSHVYAGFGLHPMIPGYFERKTGMPLSIAGDAFFNEKNIPQIHQTAQAAVEFLSRNPNGFFLMVESGLVDWIGHKNTELVGEQQHPSAIEALAKEMQETDKTVAYLAQWASQHPDTLVVVTADHETGGLQLNEKQTSCLGTKGCLPQAQWTSELYPDYLEKFSKHTGVKVGVYAMGPGSEAFKSPMDNTQFPTKILGSLP